MKLKSRLVFGEVMVSGGRVGTCTVANAVGRAALTPHGIAVDTPGCDSRAGFGFDFGVIA